MKYKEIVTNSKDEKKRDSAKIEKQVKSASIQIQRDIFDAEVIADQADKKVSNLLESDNFNSVDIINAQREATDARADVTALTALQKELF